MAFNPAEFTTQQARPLPVFLLLDTSGSMEGRKIEELNSAVKTMLEKFADSETIGTEIHVGVITFGGTAEYSCPLTKADVLLENFKGYEAMGGTPMGEALVIAKDIIEDKAQVPSRSYRPTFILVTDGAPTDLWEEPMENFIKNGRSSKCQRMAMSIQAEKIPLERFVKGTEYPVFEVDRASKIHQFFEFVTMSVTSRSKSQNPDQVITGMALPAPNPKFSTEIFALPNPDAENNNVSNPFKLD